MKKLYSLILIAALTVAALRSNAQNNNNNGSGFDQLIKSTPQDATALMHAYAEPLFKGFGIGLNSGWNNTAATKKFLHVDLRITANIAMVPTSDQSFDVTKIGLSNHITPDATSTTNIAPSFSGTTSGTTPKMDIWNDAHTQIVSTFNMPNGILYQYVPAPNVQLTIGLLKNTDLTIRTTPTISLGSDAGKVSMFGFGIKHDIIQDFAGKGKIKPFDLALAFNYSHIGYTKPLSVQPNTGATPASSGQPTDFSTQNIDASFNGVNIQAIISKKLLFFTPFASVGYQSGSTNFAVNGNFPVAGPLNTYTVITNPVSISETSISGMRGDIGFQLNLAVFRVYAAYSISGGGYNSVNGGIGLGF